jgi:TorA maturation chaperone TorD
MTDITRSTDASGSPPACEYHGARAAVYSALAGVFVYPDEASFAELTAPETLNGLADAGETLAVDAEINALRDALSAADIDQLQAAHTQLFGLPSDGDEYLVVPYEANYTVRDDMGQKQRRIAKVAGAVDALGFNFGEGFDERQDHVAVELELLQVIAAWRAVAARTDDFDDDAALERIEVSLLDEHLIDFVPSFAIAVREATEHELYRAAADLAEELVTTDHERRAELRPLSMAADGGES